MAIAVRAITRSELEQYEAIAMRTFGGDVAEGESRLAKVLRTERAYAAFDGDALVGTAGAFDHTLSVPGGSLPMAGLTFVSVLPSHRRRGVLRALMAKHDDDMATHNEAVSGLWASESSIYGRFDYGVAAEAHFLETDARTLRFPSDFTPDAVRFVESKHALENVAPLYQSAFPKRPGMFSRTEAWWSSRTLYDGPGRRGSGSNLRIATAQREGKPVGYILYRQVAGNDRGLLDGAVSIVELVGLDLQAEQSLWHFVAHLDLYPHLKYWNAPLDSALPWFVEDRRRVQRLRTDTLWLRLRDVPAALEARSYACDGSLNIKLQGEPGQGYNLHVTNGRASCAKGVAEGGITLHRKDLASLYLGGFRPSELASVGRLDGFPKIILQADALFGGTRAPWCPEIF
jgi:predicted acetyltransferase